MILPMLARSVLGRKDPFFAILRKQASVCRTSAQALWTFVTASTLERRMIETIERLEEESCHGVLELEELLARSLSSPIDREDLQSLSSRIAVILDRTTHAAHACQLLAHAPGPHHALAEHHVLVTEALERAILALTKHAYGDVAAAARQIRVRPSIRNDVDDPAGAEACDSRRLVLTSQIEGRFASLTRVCRTAGDLLTRIALKQA